MAAYIAIMFLLWPLLPRVHNELLKIALTLLPVLPVLFVVRAKVRLVLGSDELEQRIHLIGLAVAATVVSTLSLVGGFLAAADVIQLDGTILIWVWPTLMLVYAAGRGWASRRYGGSSDVLCNNGVTRYRRLLVVAMVIAAVAGLGRHQMNDYQLGMLCGMSVVFAAWGLMLAIVRWRRRQRGNHEAS
jgi:hypothetical protein